MIPRRRQRHHREVDRGLHRGPRDRERGCDLVDGSTGGDHGFEDRGAEPGQAPGPERELVCDLDERATTTGRLSTQEPGLADDDLDDLAAGGDVLDSL